MATRALPERTPYALALRWMVHALLYLLIAVAAIRILLDLSSEHAALRLSLLIALVSVYSIGARMASTRGTGHRGDWWSLRYLIPVVGLWAGSFLVSADAVWIAFGLDFAVLYALPLLGGVIGLVVITAIAVTGFGLWQGEIGPAQIVGPAIGGLVALAVVMAVRALQDEIDERTRLARDLLAAQDTISRTQREAARAEERERIARELHDTVAQSALSIQMLLDAARTSLADGDPDTASRHVAQARSTAALTSRQTRAFVDEDGSHASSGLTLAEHLRTSIEQLAPAGASPVLSLRWEVSDADLTQVPERTAVAADRIIRSLVGNVVQHADAGRGVVTVGVQDADLTLDVVDDGIGFDPRETEDFGLRTVRARARSVGGAVTVESAPGEGTAVQVVLPLARTSATPDSASDTAPASASASASADDPVSDRASAPTTSRLPGPTDEQKEPRP